MKLTKRNKVVIPVVLLLGIVVGGAVVLQTKDILAALLDAGRKVTYDCQSDTNADCDNDGLKNWQEKLYHTDPNNPDTDGDGYLDGEEVASGYDPTVKAPNDALSGTDTGKPRTPPKNLTLYLAQIISQKMSTGEIIPSSKNITDITQDPNAPYNQQAITDAFAQIGEQAQHYFVAPVIQDSEIKIADVPTTKVAVLLYSSQFESVINENTKDLKKLNIGELEMLKQTVDSKNTDNITVFIDAYQNSVAGLKNIEAPKDFAQWHKDIVGTFSLMVKIFQAVKDAQIDPAMAVAALETYEPTVEKWKTLMETLLTQMDNYK